LLDALTKVCRFYGLLPHQVLALEPFEVALAEACMIAHLDEVQCRIREAKTVFPVLDLGA